MKYPRLVIVEEQGSKSIAIALDKEKQLILANYDIGEKTNYYKYTFYKNTQHFDGNITGYKFYKLEDIKHILKMIYPKYDTQDIRDYLEIKYNFLTGPKNFKIFECHHRYEKTNVSYLGVRVSPTYAAIIGYKKENKAPFKCMAINCFKVIRKIEDYTYLQKEDYILDPEFFIDSLKGIDKWNSDSLEDITYFETPEYEESIKQFYKEIYNWSPAQTDPKIESSNEEFVHVDYVPDSPLKDALEAPKPINNLVPLTLLGLLCAHPQTVKAILSNNKKKYKMLK